MPELPEVETIARTLRPQVENRVISAVRILLPKSMAAGEPLLPIVVPARIHAVRRRAKLLLLDLAAGESPVPTHLLAFHLKMTGKLFVHGAATEPDKHTRLVFELAPDRTSPDHTGPAARLFFDDMRTFGYCRLMRPEDLASWPFWTALGPEPLTLAPEDFSRALGSRKGSIKSLLLDQTVIAGIGNIYADEACFRSGIHPATPGNRLSEAQRAALLHTVQDVLNESIKECGSSIRDYRDANGDAGAFQNSFRVYGRANQACLVCGSKLQKTVIATRTTVFCPRCQNP
ncbi:Formamidopyrimidine-DNA glycosylase [uncultured delta proteobacterium]|uniref:Formamidopyrimidine-DNA glycosylase n=1 Tax=uncultured delta proteobacterium TaxID=34034 RepID=A0A212K1G0_9DELT|nr:Formamidopyrimidine-DNA glycosylase [uncultured delta proteobacterium]